MTRRRLPRNDAAVLDASVLLQGEIAYDTTNDVMKVGDGVTLGGVPSSGVGDVTTAALAGTAAGQGAEMVGIARGTKDRTVDAVLAEMPSVTDYADLVVSGNWTPAFTAANAAARDFFVPPGTYNLEDMFVLDALGVGGRTMHMAAGATLTRTTGASTEPIVWVKNDNCAIKGSGSGSIITTTNDHPEGIVLVGHRDMTSNHANVRWCTVQDISIIGKTNYGKTSGTPDRLMRLCSSQIGGLISFFHEIHRIMFQGGNVGLEILGDSNGNQMSGLFFQYVGNATLTTHAEAIRFDGGLENIINGFFLHYSPGSAAVRMLDHDNTANGGIVTKPMLNQLHGHCEQDPTPSGGKGLIANAGCTGTANDIRIVDNCPGNDISDTFRRTNTIKLVSSEYSENAREMAAVSVFDDYTPHTDRTTLSAFVDTATQEPRLRAIYEGVDWRDLRIQMRDLFVEAQGGAVMRVGTKGLGYVASAGGTVTQATSKGTAVTLNKVTGQITTHAAALAASTAASFTVNNNKAELADFVAINHVSGGTAAAYNVTALAGAGTITVTIRNLTAGSLSEALNLRFAIIKSGDG